MKEDASRKMREKDEKRQIESVRTLVSLEIDQNLESLQNLWNQINSNNNTDKLNLSLKLIRSPLPNWKHEMWDHQTSLLAISFDRDEIQQIYSLHNTLNDLSLLYEKLHS